MSKMPWELDSFHVFLLISLVSILFSVSNRFLVLQIIEVYNEEKQIEYSLRQWYYSARKIAR